MAKPYQPLKIAGYATGLVQSREEFLLPNDAYPVLENAYVWRERRKRRQGLQLLGRLRRKFLDTAIGNSGASPWIFNIFTVLSIAGEPEAQIEVGSVIIVIGGAITFTDQGNGTLTSVTPGNSGIINYRTGDVTLTHTAGAGVATTITVNYFPGLPVMGLRSRDLANINAQQTVAFDTKYAYKFASGWQEFIPGTTWTGNDSDFFWSTNYWQSPSPANIKIFWVTNFSGPTGDPIRYTDGNNWVDFAPAIDTATPNPNRLTQCLVLLPFRGRLLAFNTWEGTSLAASTNNRQRIRWSALGNPIADVSVIFPGGTVNPNAWILSPNGGSFLDIPTTEDIVAVGFVRDNVVIYCDSSTWQLRYTGRAIQPFQIERVNSELGAEGTFSAVQFDTSLVGIGDKGVVECDSFKSERIDIKIPDLVFEFTYTNSGPERVHGIRDFQQKLAYWIYHYNPNDKFSVTYPNRRLVYNYENDSWAIFTDSLTCLGTFREFVQRTWAGSKFPWQQANFPWLQTPANFPAIVGGNQQGYVHYLSSNLQPKVSNDLSLAITGYTAGTPGIIQSVAHNLVKGQVVQIQNLVSNDPNVALNNQKVMVVPTSADNFTIWAYSTITEEFSTPITIAAGTYLGGGTLRILDNFSMVSKKFNFIDEGENIQLGFIDALFDTTSKGAVTLNVFLDYNDSTPINQYPENTNESEQPDPFFNTTVPTTQTGTLEISKNWKRAICPTRGAFITLEWTLSNAQLIGDEQASDVQIDAEILYIRKAGRQLPLGV